MLSLDHLTIIAPTLPEGVAHVEACLGFRVPLGTRHDYMGTHNHRLQLGDNVYLEIIAVDPAGTKPDRARWFGLDNPGTIRSDWEAGRRLRGWVASTDDLLAVVTANQSVFGEAVALPFAAPEFLFSIPADGSLPLDGAAPSLIDHQGNPTRMAEIPDMDARLDNFEIAHPDAQMIIDFLHGMGIDRPPNVLSGARTRLTAQINTRDGLKTLT